MCNEETLMCNEETLIVGLQRRDSHVQRRDSHVQRRDSHRLLGPSFEPSSAASSVGTGCVVCMQVPFRIRLDRARCFSSIVLSRCLSLLWGGYDY